MQNTLLSGLNVVLSAHQDEHLNLILATLTATDVANTPRRTPLQVALVIDRSGSMSGEKLEITKAAVAQFIRSLDPDDRVALVTYDDRVELVSALEAPSETLARRVESIESRGNTDLYGGWVMGAKIVGRGGRVILLSDGQANVGRFTDAESLSQHAAISYERYGVTTTTIGVGTDYDEALMAGMARTGGGAHYFAHTARSITDAFSQERYSAGSVILESLSIRCNGVTEQMGHFWSGETKKRVFSVRELKDLVISVRYTEKATGVTHTENLRVPTEFGHSEEATLEYLLQRASEAEAEMLRVRDPKTATIMKGKLREVVLALLAHPSSDQAVVAATIDRLKASIDRLDLLERNYVEEDAMMHRKRSMQSSHNLRERAKAYSSFADDQMFVMESATEHLSAVAELKVERTALALAPLDKWIEWQALPLEIQGEVIVVALQDPRRGFVISEIEKQVGLRVRAVFSGVPSEEIVALLNQAR
ncbi:MAG: VWA domain-containing protein [Armatimonadetes bacterium]|nr:VWA domain-containing protein [Armatimonadota bacterium]